MQNTLLLNRNHPQDKTTVKHRLLSIPFATPTALSSTTGPAHATEAPKEGKLAHQVMNAADPNEEYSKLTNEEKSIFLRAMNPVAVEQKVAQPKQTTTSIRSAGNCKTADHHQDWKSRWGFTVATSWLSITWCTAGNAVTSVEITNQGGETKIPGYTYTGVLNSGARPAGPVGRAYSEVGLKLGENIPVVNQLPALTPCIKLTGHADGHSESMADVGAGNGCRDI